MSNQPMVSEDLPFRGLIVMRGMNALNDEDFGRMSAAFAAAGIKLPIVLLPDGAELDVVDLDEMRRLGWMPVPKEITDQVGEVST